MARIRGRLIVTIAGLPRAARSLTADSTETDFFTCFFVFDFYSLGEGAARSSPFPERGGLLSTPV